MSLSVSLCHSGKSCSSNKRWAFIMREEEALETAESFNQTQCSRNNDAAASLWEGLFKIKVCVSLCTVSCMRVYKIKCFHAYAVRAMKDLRVCLRHTFCANQPKISVCVWAAVLDWCVIWWAAAWSVRGIREQQSLNSTKQTGGLWESVDSRFRENNCARHPDQIWQDVQS